MIWIFETIREQSCFLARQSPVNKLAFSPGFDTYLTTKAADCFHQRIQAELCLQCATEN
jgi:hypothetical protein